MKTSKKLISLIALLAILLPYSNFASSNTRNDLHIIPEMKQEEKDQAAKYVEEIGKVGQSGTVLDKYRATATKIEEKGDIGTAFATGIFSRNLIISYIIYIVKFLSQIGLLIWGIMVLYAGYQFATNTFWGDPSKAKLAIMNAIKGVLVIIFSVAILRTLTSMFIT